MVKVRVENETPSQKFKRLASARTQRVLNDLRLLGNCSGRSYEYSDDEVARIFSAIDKEVKRARARFVKSQQGERFEL